MKIVVSPDILINQLKRDSGHIAESFDLLCDEEIRAISKLLSEAYTLIAKATLNKKLQNNELHGWSIIALMNIGNSISAAAHVLRAGYTMTPGVIIRSAIEAMAVCLHGLQHPSTLKSIKKGEFHTPSAIKTAKAVVPPFGLMYGLLSEAFTHIGPLHHEAQHVGPYQELNVALRTNMDILRSATWLFYVIVEFAYVDTLGESGRYWKFKSPNIAIYDPSKSEREWQDQFFQGRVFKSN